VYQYLVHSGEQEQIMARNTSISLGEHFTDFIDDQLETGRYRSTSDVIRAGLRLLEEHEARAKALQDALIAGESSGRAMPFDGKAFLAELHQNHGC